MSAAPPMVPNINMCLRRSGQTVLVWDIVILDTNLNTIQVEAYNIYRSTNADLETFELITTIATDNITGNVDNAFTEYITGFYGYQVTAVVSSLESAPSLVAVAVDSNIGPDSI